MKGKGCLDKCKFYEKMSSKMFYCHCFNAYFTEIKDNCEEHKKLREKD